MSTYGSPQPGHHSPSATSAGSPLTLQELSKEIAQIWEEVLRTPVNPDSDYFELGGDSLAGQEISTRMVDRVGLEPQMADFYRLPTPREMSTLADDPTQDEQ